MRGHRAGHFESMEETIALLALGAEERTVLSGVHTLIVDPVNGNDTTGSIDGLPIQTIAKLNAIVNNLFFSGGTLTVRLLSSPPLTDAELFFTIQYENAIPNPDLPFGVGASPFIMLGSLTDVAHSGTLATVTPVQYVEPPGTPQRETITDPSVPDWSVFQFQPIVPTSGPDVGFFAWVAPPLPTSLSTGFTSAPTDLGGFPAQLSAGDTYNIINQTQIKLGNITVSGDGSGIVEFHDLRFIQWQNFLPEFQGGNAVVNNFDSLDLTGIGSVLFGRCRFDVTITGAGQEVCLTACCLTFTSPFYPPGTFGGRYFVIGGIFLDVENIAEHMDLSSVYFTGSTFGVAPDVTTVLDISQQFPINGILDQGCQFWDWPAGSPALQITGGTTAFVSAPLSGASANPGTCGVEVTGGGKLILLQTQSPFSTAPTPNIVGTGGYLPGSNGTDTDFVIDDILNATGDPVSRAWQEGPGAYTAQIHDSWVNFQTSQPTGFGANPADPTSRSNAQSVASGALIANADLDN